MSTDKETEAAAADACVEQPPSTAEEAKPAKEKKTRAPKEKKPKQPKTAAHPPYFQMIKEAIFALDEKSGSSPYAIAKYMEEKHKAVLPSNFKKILSLQLKNSAARGKLIKIRASYKLSDSNKKEKDTKVSKAATNKTQTKPKKTGAVTTRKTRSLNKVEAPKKGGGSKKAKKTGSAKPKQPKSIKSPAAKRTKKVAVANAA
ncbi:histone H1 [Mercurialis annua]|uniref:histone H1 n=1 Tax=Mercurialis annua TaxID=3986 RepID=UPI0021604588|nr:histone H1 [Mercurialis annua]